MRCDVVGFMKECAPGVRCDGMHILESEHPGRAYGRLHMSAALSRRGEERQT